MSIMILDSNFRKDNKINESQKFVTGDENEQAGGVFGLSKFWKNGN